MPKPPRPNAKLLSDAPQIAEKALGISVVKGMDPFAAVQQAAEELLPADSAAHERVIEELSDAGTAPRGRTRGAELFTGVAARLRDALARTR